jgi:hypothetical protein
MGKAYLANSAPIATGKLAGTERWVELANKYSGGALWNNGTFVNRDIRGKPGQVSNHARGLAMDLSYRFMPNSKKGVTDGRRLSLQFINQCLANYDVLGIQLVIDYHTAPLGRSWRSDRAIDGPNALPNHREAWRTPTVKTFLGAPGGDWWHVEITKELANDPKAVTAAFTQVFGVSTTTV